LIQTIPQDQWSEVCAGFASRHRGWLARVMMVSDTDAATEEQELAVDVPLRAILVEGQGADARIRILAGEVDDPVAYPVPHPRVLMLEHRPDGSEAGLRIDDAEGARTLVRFRVIADPETLDGLAAAEL